MDPSLTRPVPGCDSLVPALFRMERPVSAGWRSVPFPPALRVLPLLSQVAFLSQAGESLPVPSRFGSCCPPPCFRLPAAAPEGGLTPRQPAPVSRSGCDTGTFRRHGLVRGRQAQAPALAHSSNFRDFPDCVRPARRKPLPGMGVTRLAAVVSAAPAAGLPAACRLAPCSQQRQGATLARGSR